MHELHLRHLEARRVREATPLTTAEVALRARGLARCTFTSEPARASRASGRTWCWFERERRRPRRPAPEPDSGEPPRGSPDLRAWRNRKTHRPQEPASLGSWGFDSLRPHLPP